MARAVPVGGLAGDATSPFVVSESASMEDLQPSEIPIQSEMVKAEQ
jgi:hypothetical protein